MIISLDRLSRFKPPEDTYPRVFYSIISKCLINPKFSKTEMESLPAEDVAKYVKNIWNNSVEKLWGIKTLKNHNANIALKLSSELSFKNTDPKTKIFIETDLNISPILEHIKSESIPINLKYLIKANSFNNINKDNLYYLRENFSLKFPIKKLIIVEGITEEILLPVFAAKLKEDFNKFGIYILGAGGKSKSPSLYLKLKDKLNIPVIMLFDKDAKEICDILQSKIREQDKIILLSNGEFEDILSTNLIKRTLNNEYDLSEPINKSDLKIHSRMCENLEDFYRTRNLGEFKKAKFSKLIADNIKYETDISIDIRNLINDIIRG